MTKLTDLNSHGLVLALLQQLGQSETTRQHETGRGIEIGTELSESGNITVLGQVQLEGTGDRLHDLGLSGGSDTGHGQTDVDGGTDTLEEELGLEEDLSIGDGNDVGRNVSRDITTLGLNDGESGEGSSSVLVTELGGTLEQTRVEVEDVSGVSLTSRRTTEQEGHLTVSDGLLGQVIEDDQGVLAVVTEPLSDGGTSEGGEVLKRSGLGSSGGDDDRVLHGIILLKGLNELRDGRTLLSDGDVHAVQLGLLVVAIVPLLLVQDGVDGDSSLAGLTITDDELTLTTTDGNHGVDGLETSQHGLRHGLTGQDTGGLDLGTTTLGGLDGALAIDGVAEGVDDTAEHLGTDGDVDDVSSALDRVALLAVRGNRTAVVSGLAQTQRWVDSHETIVTEDGDTDVVCCECT